MELGTEPGPANAAALAEAAWFEIVEDIEKRGLPALVDEGGRAYFGLTAVSVLREGLV